MADNEVIDKDLGWNDLLKSLARLESDSDKGVTVGVHGKEGSDEVIKAASNEFGTETIPERSFLRSTMVEHEADIVKGLESAVSGALDNKRSFEHGLGVLGEQAVGWVKRKIIDITQPPNAPSTIAGKIRRSGKEGTPLIDTGRMLQSIDWEIDE